MTKNKIKFVDLGLINKKYKAKYLNIIKKIYDNSSFIKSKYNSILERQICKTFKCKYSLCLNSGTDALIIAVKSLGLKDGDEILTTSNTWISSAYAISLNNCKPVFVDINEKYLQMDEKLLKKKLTKKTKAIMVTHLYGNPSEMDYICSFAKKHKLYIIEDIAQSQLASFKNKLVGNFGDIACMSFYPSKNIGAVGDGGAIICNSKKLIQKAIHFANYGSDNFKDKDHKIVGFNSRMDELQAAFLNLKIKDLKKNNKVRKKLAKIYDKECDSLGIKRIHVMSQAESAYYVYPIIVKKRNLLMRELKKRGIYSQIHYEVPIHLQTAYSKKREKDLKTTEKISKNILSLPFYPGIKKKQIDRIFNIIKKNKDFI
tara:strand:+ start:1288 stop:2403 length:1116 start_codon:yes stop_codon:yes gene_type:complete